MKQHLSIEETGIKGLCIINPASYRHDEDLILETYNSHEMLKKWIEYDLCSRKSIDEW